MLMTKAHGYDEPGAVFAVAATDVEHARPGFDHLGDLPQILAQLAHGARRHRRLRGRAETQRGAFAGCGHLTGAAEAAALSAAVQKTVQGLEQLRLVQQKRIVPVIGTPSPRPMRTASSRWPTASPG